MRKTFIAVSAAAALSLSAASAVAQDRYYPDRYYYAPAVAPLAAGAAIGTVAGIGLYNGWWSSSVVGTTLGSSVAGSAVAGGVIGVGAAGLIHAATTPCKGFDALLSPFRPGPSGCVNGEFVGYRTAARVNGRGVR